jgi:hypothetical protein
MPRFPHNRNENVDPRRVNPWLTGRSSPGSRTASSSDVPRRAKPPGRNPAGPQGPARVEPSIPASGKQRRRMAKATAWRLATLIHMRPSDLLNNADLPAVLEKARAHPSEGANPGEAARLAAKLLRLRKK